ncbi:hypothetical protein CQW23_13814 [Capsicum baccatum]|uniref:Uncharacterized protein n=1 Tax=Capsicum baccatum TaxID=33114 RepID=A0A2G2WHD6_CAPBA|nr:hypothetical protein CQW23_13814 [Capsicum baccatum]PHU13599.1 hypothetical protein BC332_14804 [Capsicum chinense]
MSKYDSMDDLSPELVPTARHTRIDSFRNLIMLSVPTRTGHFRIGNLGAKFLLGGRDSLRMVDLGELSNSYGSLSIIELQNMVDNREALKANMREKNHLE